MANELTTTALDQMYLYSWWWLLAPVVVGVLMIAVGIALREELPAGFGTFILFVGTLIVGVINLAPGSYNADLLRSDVAGQLQIEETVKNGDWYTGRGPDGEYVKFALVEKGGMDNTYAVLVEK